MPSVAHETAADESFNRPAPDILYRAGVRILVVYPWGPGKAITQPEVDAYLNYRGPDGGRIALLFVDEHGNQQMLAGPGFGTSIAQENMAQSAARIPQLKGSRPLYYVAEDPNPLPQSDWPAVVDRFREICAAHLAQGWILPGDTVGSSLVGAYGGGPLLEHLYDLGLVGHQVAPDGHPYGWLWPVGTWGACPHAAIIQDPNTGQDRLGGAIDWDYLAPGVIDCGQYPAPNQTARPSSSTEGDPMFIRHSSGAVIWANPAFALGLSGGPGGEWDAINHAHAAQQPGQPLLVQSDELFNAMVNAPGFVQGVADVHNDTQAILAALKGQSPGAGPSTLSDADVDRVAQRVVAVLRGQLDKP